MRVFPTMGLPSEYGLGIFSNQLEIRGFIHGQLVKVRYIRATNDYSISFMQEAVTFQTTVIHTDLKRYSDDQKLIIDPYRVDGCNTQIKNVRGEEEAFDKEDEAYMELLLEDTFAELKPDRKRGATKSRKMGKK